MEILIKRLNDHASIPAYGHETGPGMDLFALETVTIEPGTTVRVSTGVAIAMPVGYIGLLWSYNPMLITDTLRVTPGMIDSGFRDEVIIELTNIGVDTRIINGGNVVAQLLVQQVHLAHIIEAEDFSSGR